MVKKVNSLLVRKKVSNNQECMAKYTELTKTEYSLLLYKNLQVKEYFTCLFKEYGLLLIILKV